MPLNKPVALETLIISASALCLLSVALQRMGWTNSLADSKSSAVEIKFQLKEVSKIAYDYNNDGEILNHTLKKLTGTSGPYQLDEEVVDDNGLITIRLSYQGKLIFSKQQPRWKGLCEDSYTIVDPRSEDTPQNMPVLRDINADGMPELVLIRDYGSPHGTVDMSIYQIRPGKNAPVQLAHDELQSPTFIQNKSTGAYDISIDDQTFAYWKNSAYCDYSPTSVMLSLRDGKWQPNIKLMTEAAPSKIAFEKSIQTLNKGLAPCDHLTKPKKRAITPSVWNEMKDLVYKGHAELAKQMLKELYPPGTTLLVAANETESLKTPGEAPALSHQQFWKDFCDTVKKSTYAKTLLEMDTQHVLTTPWDSGAVHT